jgi:hypothetical protein
MKAAAGLKLAYAMTYALLYDSVCAGEHPPAQSHSRPKKLTYSYTYAFSYGCACIVEHGVHDACLPECLRKDADTTPAGDSDC